MNYKFTEGSGQFTRTDVLHGAMATVTFITMSMLTPPVINCFFSIGSLPDVVPRAVS